MQAQTWYQKARGAYDSLVLAIIRPPRSAYELADLGPSKFAFCGKFFKRTDFAIKNAKGQKLCCSMWEPFEIDKKGDGVKSSSALSPCVIYMHGNSSNRREAISQLSLVLSLGAKLVTLDFSGSGKSDGEYVSLGVHEKDDLQCLIKHLRDSGTVGKIGLWGRSMGAATCLLHGRRDSELACMVCDSPFSSLVALAEGMVETGRKHGIYAPGFLISLAIRFIRSSVQDKAGFDVYDLNPAEEAEHSIVPLLLIAAEGDAFIPPSHAQLIYHNYGGPKHAIIVQGDHNSIRPKKASGKKRSCVLSLYIYISYSLSPHPPTLTPGPRQRGHFFGQRAADSRRGHHSRRPALCRPAAMAAAAAARGGKGAGRLFSCHSKAAGAKRGHWCGHGQKGARPDQRQALQLDWRRESVRRRQVAAAGKKNTNSVY